MLYVFLYHTPNPEKLQVFSHFPHKIHPKSGTNPHFLTTPPSPPLTPGFPQPPPPLPLPEVPQLPPLLPLPEVPAADRGAAKGLRGAIALRTAGTYVRGAQNPGRNRVLQNTISGDLSGESSSEFLRESSRCPGFCVSRALVPALHKAVPRSPFAAPRSAASPSATPPSATPPSAAPPSALFLKKKSPRQKSPIASPHSILFQFSHQLSQEIPAPAGISFSGLISAKFPSASSAHSSIPSDTIPASLAGFRFVTTMTFLPTISSGE